MSGKFSGFSIFYFSELLEKLILIIIQVVHVLRQHLTQKVQLESGKTLIERSSNKNFKRVNFLFFMGP